MAAHNRIDTLEHARRDEIAGTAGQQLLGVLEEKAHFTVKAVAQTDQHAGDRKQHGGVAVVTARVHHAVAFGGERQAAFFSDR
jgi:hypothetical protein